LNLVSQLSNQFATFRFADILSPFVYKVFSV